MHFCTSTLVVFVRAVAVTQKGAKVQISIFHFQQQQDISNNFEVTENSVMEEKLINFFFFNIERLKIFIKTEKKKYFMQINKV